MCRTQGRQIRRVYQEVLREFQQDRRTQCQAGQVWCRRQETLRDRTNLVFRKQQGSQIRCVDQHICRQGRDIFSPEGQVGKGIPHNSAMK